MNVANQSRLSFRQLFLYALVGVTSAIIGWSVGRFHAGSSAEIDTEQVVAVSWGDGKYGPAFYGAFVYLVPIPQGFSVRSRVFIGRGNGYFHDIGEIGRVGSSSDAVATWGLIRWAPEGLYIGISPRTFFYPRAKLESHR